MLAQERATGRDVILAIGENMRQSLEPLVTKTIAPSLYHVYLHSDDYDHLRTLFNELEAEAKRLLDNELARLNRGTTPALDRLLKPLKKSKDPEKAAEPAMKYVSAEGRWVVRFQEDPNGTLGPGDIQVVSEFAQGASEGYGAGSMTRRISTTRRLGQAGMLTERETAPASSSGPLRMAGSGATAAQPVPQTWARIEYQDDGGKKVFLVTKDEVVIGREAPDVWVDLRLETSLDVSREHARLQRTPAGSFRIKDLSKLGTTVNGTPVPASLHGADHWVDLPDRARIGLAGVVYLDFERTAPA
jgi:hypothetical protein